MKWLWISDLHTSTTPPPGRSTNPFYEVAFEKIRWLGETYRPDAILCGGDVFHSRSGARPNPSVGHVLALKDFIDKLELPWYIVPGNHDLAFDTPKEKELSPLSLLAGDDVDVFWEPSSVANTGEVLCVPYGTTASEWDFSDWTKTVALHTSIAVEGTLPSMVEYMTPQAALDHYKTATLILCGHIHIPFVYEEPGTGRKVVNTGPFVRRTVDEINRVPVPLAAIFDDDDPAGSVRVVEVPPVDDFIRDVVDRSTQRTIDLSKVIAKASEGQFTTVDETSLRGVLEQWAEENELWIDEAVFTKAVDIAVVGQGDNE